VPPHPDLTYGVIDAHTHVNPFHMLNPGAEDVFRRQHGERWPAIRQLVEEPTAVLKAMDDAGIERIALVNYVAPDVIGYTAEVNEWVVGYAKAAPDRFIPVGSINPRFVADCGSETRRLVDLGIRALKLHSAHELVYPNAYRDGGELPGMAAMYEQAQDLGVPFIFHTGTSIFPLARVKYAEPLHLDDVLVDFPRLKVVMAHGGRPLWVQQCEFLLRRRPGVYIDLSSLPPRQLPRVFPRLESMADRLLYGSDWPAPGPTDLNSNIEAILELELSDEAKRKILRDTALEVFNL